MISPYSLLVFLVFVSLSNLSFSQVKVKKTDVNSDIDIVRVYERVVLEGYGTPFIYRKLATSYYFKSEYKKALDWFHILFSEEKISDPELNQQYMQSLKAVALENLKIQPKRIF